MPPMAIPSPQSALTDYFTPWVQALDLAVIASAADGRSVCRAATTYARL